MHLFTPMCFVNIMIRRSKYIVPRFEKGATNLLKIYEHYNLCSPTEIPLIK